MIRSLIVALILLGGAFSLSHFYIGYARGGSHYIQKQRTHRKSVRTGSGYYGPAYGAGGLRGGK